MVLRERKVLAAEAQEMIPHADRVFVENVRGHEVLVVRVNGGNVRFIALPPHAQAVLIRRVIAEAVEDAIRERDRER